MDLLARIVCTCDRLNPLTNQVTNNEIDLACNECRSY